LSARPISLVVDATIWSQYKTGVISNCGSAVNHGGLLVGSNNDYWTIKNSWGTSWGESGYIRLAKGDTCGVCSYASYPTL
jgi:C1A family cysteine protease